ncbi:MAG: hypothetical protein H8D34_05735 [Chloroflexi bacterium]|nr:hypothetical protein [Chloroflexota bacterium]
MFWHWVSRQQLYTLEQYLSHPHAAEGAANTLHPAPSKNKKIPTARIMLSAKTISLGV